MRANHRSRAGGGGAWTITSCFDSLTPPLYRAAGGGGGGGGGVQPGILPLTGGTMKRLPPLPLGFSFLNESPGR